MPGSHGHKSGCGCFACKGKSSKKTGKKSKKTGRKRK